MRFWHLNLTLGASLIASSASFIPGYPLPSIYSQQRSSPTGPQVAALIPVASFRWGLVRTLSRHSRPTPFRTLPRTIVTRLASGLSSKRWRSPEPGCVAAFNSLRSPLPAIEPLGSQQLEGRLDAVTRERVRIYLWQAELCYANSLFHQKWPTKNTHSSRSFN